MFSMICEKVVSVHIRKVRASTDRKMAGVFAADILTKGYICIINFNNFKKILQNSFLYL